MSGFLDKIGGFFEKPFLVAAVLPLLVAGLLLSCAAAYLLGLGALLSWIADLSTPATVALSAAATMTLFVLAFVLRSLRATLIELWSGEHWLWSVTGIGLLTAWSHRRCRDKLIAEMAQETIWTDATGRFRNRLKSAATGATNGIDRAKEREFIRRIDQLREDIISQDIHEVDIGKRLKMLLDDVVAAYGQHSAESMTEVYYYCALLTDDLTQIELGVSSRARVDRNLRFGSGPDVRATRFGNALEAIDAYPYRLYRMEGGIFWTHLETVMKDTILADVREQRMLVDFGLAMTSLLLMMGLVLTFAGPWFVPHWGIFAVAAALFAASYLFYRVAVSAVVALGRVLRAGCDLHRHDLLKALSKQEPADLKSERELWRQLSELSLYGDTERMNVVFRAAEPRPTVAS